MNDMSDYSPYFDTDNYAEVAVTLPRDIVESVENFARFAPENNINAAYAWLLRRGIQYERSEGKAF